ncbi:MAG: hypothetical protein EOP53_25080 [Sphingobacteriales bacterium]|nr:MAG: hypothetical protein EOP53_25080 [Sphingobacteriales bacterium]
MSNKKVNCFGCHNTDVFIMDNPRNNGLTFDNPDEGIFTHTQNSMDIGKFKAPTLKNMALRENYMHDGIIRGIMGVLNHYNSGIKANVNLDPHLNEKGVPAQMNLRQEELLSLKAFLETLTDHKIIADKKFSSPFR